MNDKTPLFLSTAEAANMLGLSTTLVQSLVDRNELQGWKTRGGHRRISLQSIHDYQNQSRMPSHASFRSRVAPKVLVATETPDAVEHLKKMSEEWDFPVTLKFVDSITEVLLNLGTEAPDLLVVELNLPRLQQEKTLIALENFNVRNRPVSVVLLSQERSLRPSSPDSPSPIQLAHGPLSDVWLHAYLTGVVAQCRT